MQLFKSKSSKHELLIVKNIGEMMGRRGNHTILTINVLLSPVHIHSPQRQNEHWAPVNLIITTDKTSPRHKDGWAPGTTVPSLRRRKNEHACNYE